MSLDALIEQLRRLLGGSDLLFYGAIALLLLLACIVGYGITKRVILRLIDFLAKRTKTDWDDVIIERGVFERLALITPALVLYFSVYPFGQETQNILQRLIIAYMMIVVVRTLFAFMDSVDEIYRRANPDKARRIPIKGYLQVAKMLLFLIGAVVVISNVMGRSPWAFLTGLGAASAILMLVFKDTILSFVAGIQIASNDLMRIGDWISMPQCDADGDVIDIALHVVRVQNWDKTITTIPTHKFLEQPFKNWRGMQESGGRRIKRSLYIDQSTIRFLDEEEIEKLSRVEILKDYLASKRSELDEHNKAHDPGSAANVRRLTNIGTFRAYMQQYVSNHPKTNKKMTLLIRQLQPTPEGLPLEVYTFTDDIRWAFYEGIQSDIFDHLLAVLPEFGLRVFQKPSGHDVAALEKLVPATPS